MAQANNSNTSSAPDTRKASVLIVGVGASRGLGAASARRFAAGDYPIVVAGRNTAKIENLVRELQTYGATAAGVVGDAAKTTNTARFVEAAEKLAPLAVAVHNAGATNPRRF